MKGDLSKFPEYKITKKIRLIELFGGIGSQAMALRDIGANFEHYKMVELDKYAVQSYNAIHGTWHTTYDIRSIHGADLEIKEKEKYCYLMTYSFPCTDLSVAGKKQGMSKEQWTKGESTRSGLLWEVERILKELPKDQFPDVLLMENVPQVHSKRNLRDFQNWQSFLWSKGYFNFWEDLNAKNYGIPQNRERCFMVSILSDSPVDFHFPPKEELKKVMKDFLEEKVDEKYYITSEKADKLIAKLIETDVLPALSSCQVSGVKRLGNLYGEDKGTGFAGNVWDKNNLCPTLMTMQGGRREPMIIDDAEESKKYRIRKLTPRECWHLMGYTNEDFDKVQAAGVSNSQLYKQAGNAIVKQVLMAIFSKLIY